MQTPTQNQKTLTPVTRYVVVSTEGHLHDDITKVPYKFSASDIHESENAAYSAVYELLNENSIMKHDYDWLFETLNDMFAENNDRFHDLFETALKRLSPEELEPYGSLIYGSDWMGYGYYNEDCVLAQYEGTEVFLLKDYEISVMELPFLKDAKGNLCLDFENIDGVFHFLET